LKFFSLHNHLSKRSLLTGAVVLLLLSFTSAWFFHSKPSVTHQQRLLQDFINEQQEDVSHLLSDTALLRKLVLHKESREEFERLEKKEYGIFVFAETISDNQDLVFWNSHRIVPPAPDFTGPDSIYFQQLVNGYYVIHTKGVRLHGMTSNYKVYALIPVLNKYYLEADNLKPQFVHSKAAIDKIQIADSALTEFPIRSTSSQILFYIQQATYNLQNHVDPVTLLLRLLALGFLLLYLHLLTESIYKRRGPMTAVAFLVLSLIFCRLILFYYPSLFSLRQLDLFDPSIYAANNFNKSLGDLLINALFLCWIVLFAWARLGPVESLPSVFKRKGVLLAGVFGVFVLIFATFQLASLIYDLVANSKVPFEVTDFFRLNDSTIFGFIILALLSLAYYYFSRLLFRFILLAFPSLINLYLAIAVVGLLFLTVRTGDLIVLFYIPVLGWLILYTLLLSREHLIINRLRITVAGMLFWLVIFSLSIALLIMQGNREKEWRQRRAIAEKFDQVSDPSKERTLSVALAYLKKDYLKNNFPRFYNEPENTILRDSFITYNFLGYSNSYNTDFYVFGANNEPINNKDRSTYNELNNILTVQSKAVGDSGLHYYETSFDEFIYITKREAFDSGKLIGTVFIVSAPKHFQNQNNVYPVIFRQSDPNNIENSSIYSYAIYENGLLKNHSSKYSFPTKLYGDRPAAEITKKDNGDYNELWLKGGKDKLIVVAKKNDSFIESITLFSYLFCAFLFMIALLRLLIYIGRIARDLSSARFSSGLNIRSQIHVTIIFISAVSFLIIGAATISFFIQRYNRNNADRLSRTAYGTVREMEQKVESADLLTNDVINFSDSASTFLLRRYLGDIANVNGMIVNIYDLSGTLQVTSDEEIYKRGLLSAKMHPRAFYDLKNAELVQKVQKEEINQYPYQSIYIAMRNKSGVTYAYLNIPSFTSQFELQQEISNFFVTIINLNAFIFLIAGVIALFITNRITRSFSIIGDKMKAITLGKTNEEIVWTRDDEIGELVRQYNKMVHQLEQSAEALAKSEREGAWREMARQVAHEIKNPLTPMKLSIQYLQRAIQTNQPNVQLLTSNVATTLIEQIDHLSKIAADFSQFANIGHKKPEQIDLHSVIRSLVDLYSSNPAIVFQWNEIPQPLFMYADKTHMNRLFTNLLTNAVDACSEARSCYVSIHEKIEGEHAIISVTDNGEGIPAEMKSKIFTPNFTTKTSGTGLGLAMCKSIVEQAGGSIWFDTKEGEGTTFYVQLPLSQS
jgi:two-component system, NtrC family, nitrogen regulation sensor histidine kinase NtrY